MSESIPEFNLVPPAGFELLDVERFAPEPWKRSGRSPFARDRARVLHSAGLRRLAAKTQVLVAGESDFPRTRLTHTLEVAQIAREMGGLFGTDPDLTDLAGLAHDLGHPPFGHNGEDALNQVMEGAGGFEGNAQTFRMLTRIEVKVVADGRSLGLNLTRAALDATMKYPWFSPVASDRSADIGRPKFGCYADDAQVFNWVREGAPERRVCFEAQIMDWSDDVAYSVHDVEDGIQAGHIDVRALRSATERNEIAKLAHEWYAPWAEREELAAALERIAESAAWPESFDGGPTALADLKHFTSTITGRFVAGAIATTRAEFGTGPLLRHGADLRVARPVRCEVAAMKALADLYVFQRPDAERAYQWQRELLRELVAGLLSEEGRHLDPVHRPVFAAATNDDQRLRSVVDQVASLTDHSVLVWHRRICV